MPFRRMQRIETAGLAIVFAGALLGTLPRAAEAADAFAIGAQFAGHAVTSCSNIVISGGTIDSAGVSSASPANKGHVASNGSLAMSGSSTINGDASVGPGKKITTSGSAKVTGASSVATSTFDCMPVDLVALKTALQSSNDNARIPQTSQHKNPLTGAGHTDFVMSGADSLNLPAGTYYFTSVAVSGTSVITTAGPVHILVTGSVSVSGGTTVGSGSYALRLWVSGSSFALSTGTVKAFVYAPSAAASVSNATLTGGLWATGVTISGNSHLTRTIDDVAPHIAITSPPDGSAVADPAHVVVTGTVSDGETDVSAAVNGQTVTIAADGTWQITLNLSSGTSPVTVTAVATDAGGNTATATTRVVTAPPSISLTSPLPGALLAAHVVNLTGAAGTATSLTVNGTPAAIAGGLWSLNGFDLGSDGTHTLAIRERTPQGQRRSRPCSRPTRRRRRSQRR